MGNTKYEEATVGFLFRKLPWPTQEKKVNPFLRRLRKASDYILKPWSSAYDMHTFPGVHR
jgi:hypothetical protein